MHRRGRGQPVAGIGPLQGEEQPAAWTLYLASDDADRTAADVAEHGGTVLMPPVMDVGRMGRMLIASDPAGGVFGRLVRRRAHRRARWSTSPAA